MDINFPIATLTLHLAGYYVTLIFPQNEFCVNVLFIFNQYDTITKHIRWKQSTDKYYLHFKGYNKQKIYDAGYLQKVAISYNIIFNYIFSMPVRLDS